MMVRVGGGWDTLEHFLSRHEPCQVRLVTQGRRGSVLPVALPSPSPSSDTSDGKISPVTRKHDSISPTSSKTSSFGGKESSLHGTISPVDSKASSVSGKMSPVELKSKKYNSSSSKTSSGKSSPVHNSSVRRTSTPKKPDTVRSLKSALTLPLKSSLDVVDGCQSEKAPTLRARKQSAPSSLSSTAITKQVRKTTNGHTRSSTGGVINIPKKSKSMFLSTTQSREESKSFCGTERLNSKTSQNNVKNRSMSLATTPIEEPVVSNTKKTRSQSLASTPDKDFKKTFCGTDKLNSYAKKTRSMSLASPIAFRPINNKSLSVTGSGITQAAIEESIRISLAANAADNTSPKKPFLHIKAKYRSPPPREVPPR